MQIRSREEIFDRQFAEALPDPVRAKAEAEVGSELGVQLLGVASLWGL
jgi:hypothetical protein